MSLNLFRDWPAFLLLLLVAVPLLAALFQGPRGTLRFSTLQKLKRLRPSWTLRARHALVLLRVLALVLIVVALARPQRGKTETRVHTEGIDIELVVDISLSMLALDLDPRLADPARAERDLRSGRLKLTDLKNRLEVVKDVVREFVKGRGGDRIGLTVFAESAQLQCPLTTNHGILLDILKRVRLPTPRELNLASRRRESVFGMQTNIAAAIASGANRLVNSKSKSRIMILLTDGVHNVQDYKFTPETATQMASALDIKIYSIGAGTEDQSVRLSEDMDGSPSLEPMGESEIDERLMKAVAEATKGKYFRAKDEGSLRAIYEEIDKMEKVETEGTKYSEYFELFSYFLVPALGLLLIEMGLGNTRLQKLP